MGIFKNLFGSNSNDKNKSGKSEYSFDIKNRTDTIYPYFKQILELSQNSEELPENLKEIDKTKSYKSDNLKLITKQICADLKLFYVLDNDNGYEFIQEQHLNSVNINSNQLHEIAMHNFQDLISKKMRNQNNDDAIWFFVDGNLEACLMLVDEIWEQVQNFIKDDVVVCVPARDIIFATGANKTKVINDFSEKAKEILNSGDHPLSKNWFIRNENKWEVFKEII